MRAGDVAVYIDPFSRRNEQDGLFDPTRFPDTGDNAFEPFIHMRRWLRERGVEVHTADLLDASSRNGRAVSVFLSFGMRSRYKRLAQQPNVLLSGFFAFECPIVLPTLYADLHNIGSSFKRVFSFTTEDAVRPFLRGPVEFTRFMLPQSFDDVHQSVWERRERKFLVMVTGNKKTRIKTNELYTERLRAIEFFNRYGEIDLYGREWDAPPARMASGKPRVVQHAERRIGKWWHSVRPSRDQLWVAVRETNRGPTQDKAETLGGYTFAVCFENMILEGWITEKIFDCFYAGTVPIYLGATDIERWVPSECFIDMRTFSGYEELREFLHSLTPDQIEAYRVAARDFIRSERFRPFSKQTFAELIGRIVEEDTGVSL